MPRQRMSHAAQLNIQMRREQLQISRSMLAEVAHLPYYTLRRIEAHERPATLTEGARIEAALDALEQGVTSARLAAQRIPNDRQNDRQRPHTRRISAQSSPVAASSSQRGNDAA